jgi:secondary thiamine-phosphate synthase enzyme
MKSHTEYLTFTTKKPREYLNITDQVTEAVSKSTVKEGLCLVSAMHITAGVYVNDDEPGFRSDLTDMLERIAPEGADYRHHETGETNGDAHLKNMLTGFQVVLPITKGELDLGPWQQVFYAEFDGRRRKRVVVKIIGE